MTCGAGNSENGHLCRPHWHVLPAQGQAPPEELRLRCEPAACGEASPRHPRQRQQEHEDGGPCGPARPHRRSLALQDPPPAPQTRPCVQGRACEVPVRAPAPAMCPSRRNSPVHTGPRSPPQDPPPRCTCWKPSQSTICPQTKPHSPSAGPDWPLMGLDPRTDEVLPGVTSLGRSSPRKPWRLRLPQPGDADASPAPPTRSPPPPPWDTHGRVTPPRGPTTCPSQGEVTRNPKPTIRRSSGQYLELP